MQVVPVFVNTTK